MTPEELITRLKAVQTVLESETRNQAAALATTGLALIKNRIIQRQEDEKGAKFDNYSNTPLPLFFFEARVLNKAGFERLKKQKQKTKGKQKNTASYYEFRKSQGLQNKSKNFEFSGQMWREIGFQVVEKGEGNFLIVIAPQTNYAQKTYGYNVKREGSLLVLSEQEKQMLRDAFKKWILNVFTQNGLSILVK